MNDDFTLQDNCDIGLKCLYIKKENVVQKSSQQDWTDKEINELMVACSHLAVVIN